MKPITVNELSVSGTGVGSTDLYPLNIVTAETVSGIDIDTVIGSGNLYKTLSSYAEYKYNMNLQVIPGYFYITDKEFYHYNTKITQFSRPVVNSGENYASVQLYSYPDAMQSYYEKTGEKLKGGAAPIIVEVFPSGALSELGIIFDSPVSSAGSAWGYGYRLSGRDKDTNMLLVISGEPGDYPGYVSPLNNYEKCYENWFTTNMLGEHEYFYDIETNSIVFSGTPEDLCKMEVAIHWEGANEPFPISDVNLNPVETLPENGIVCLGPDGLSSEPITDIQITSDRSTLLGGEYTEIVAVCRSSSGNRIANAKVKCLVDFFDINVSGYLTGVDTYIGSGTPYSYIYSEVRTNPFDSKTAIKHDSITIGTKKVTAFSDTGKFLHMSPGCLYSENTTAERQTLECTTDSTGTVTFGYQAPFLPIGNYNIRITCFSEDVSSATSMKLKLDQKSDSYILDAAIRPYIYLCSGEYVTDNEYRVQLPTTFSPCEFSGCILEDYVSYLYTGTKPTWLPASRFEHTATSSGSFYGFATNSFDDYINVQTGPISGIFQLQSSEIVIMGVNIYNQISLDRRSTHDNY